MSELWDVGVGAVVDDLFIGLFVVTSRHDVTVRCLSDLRS